MNELEEILGIQIFISKRYIVNWQDQRGCVIAPESYPGKGDVIAFRHGQAITLTRLSHTCIVCHKSPENNQTSPFTCPHLSTVNNSMPCYICTSFTRHLSPLLLVTGVLCKYI